LFDVSVQNVNVLHSRTTQDSPAFNVNEPEIPALDELDPVKVARFVQDIPFAAEYLVPVEYVGLPT